MASQLTVRDVLAGRAPQDASVTVKGWVRTRRDSKAGFSFVNVSDGSSFHPVQVVAANTLPALSTARPQMYLSGGSNSTVERPMASSL